MGCGVGSKRWGVGWVVRGGCGVGSKRWVWGG